MGYMGMFSFVSDWCKYDDYCFWCCGNLIVRCCAHDVIRYRSISGAAVRKLPSNISRCDKSITIGHCRYSVDLLLLSVNNHALFSHWHRSVDGMLLDSQMKLNHLIGNRGSDWNGAKCLQTMFSKTNKKPDIR